MSIGGCHNALSKPIANHATSPKLRSPDRGTLAATSLWTCRKSLVCSLRTAIMMGTPLNVGAATLLPSRTRFSDFTQTRKEPTRGGKLGRWE